MGQWGLADWADLAGDPWPNLLVGNGLSISVSPEFNYGSLYAAANLPPEQQMVFGALGTENFELVLDYLRVARGVCDHLHDGAADVQELLDSVRDRLIETVNNAHIAHGLVGQDRLLSIRNEFREHAHVWSTSYDLIAYWALMVDGAPAAAGLGDTFWNADHAFDATNASPFDADWTTIWWPHGSLHLWLRADGVTVKRANLGVGNLLQNMGVEFAGAEMPLFVSEGTAGDKLAAIARSDYLRHAYARLTRATGAFAVHGQSLAEVDSHLIDALLTRPDRRIAYGVFATSQPEADGERARIELLFPEAELHFYDSTTHPLAN